jgi:hypothetical protein
VLLESVFERGERRASKLSRKFIPKILVLTVVKRCIAQVRCTCAGLDINVSKPSALVVAAHFYCRTSDFAPSTKLVVGISNLVFFNTAEKVFVRVTLAQLWKGTIVNRAAIEVGSAPTL